MNEENERMIGGAMYARRHAVASLPSQNLIHNIFLPFQFLCGDRWTAKTEESCGRNSKLFILLDFVPPLDDNRRFGDVDGCFFRNLRQSVEDRP